MAHQLHVLQTLMLNVLEDKMNKVIDPNDADAQEKIKELRRIAFDSVGGGLDPASFKDVTARKASPKDFRKLGFRNDANPLLDFGQLTIPPTFVSPPVQRLPEEPICSNLSNKIVWNKLFKYEILMFQVKFLQVLLHWTPWCTSPAIRWIATRVLCWRIPAEETTTSVRSPGRSLN